MLNENMFETTGIQLENGHFYAESYLVGDPDKLAGEVALTMRANNGLGLARRTILAPARWEIVARGVHFSLVGKSSDRFSSIEEVSCLLEELFEAKFELRPLLIGCKEDRVYIDAMQKLMHNNVFFDGYPTKDDVLSAGNEENAVLGSQGQYAANSPYFFARVHTKTASTELNTQALSAACKTMYQRNGILVSPREIFQLDDGRFEMRLVGSTSYTWRPNRASTGFRRQDWIGSLQPADSSVANPISHYLGVSVEELRIYKTTAGDYEDIIEAEHVSDELSMLGVPEPEDFIVRAQEEVAALDAKRAYTNMASTAEPELTGLQELERLVGLEEVKRQIKEFVQYAATQKMRKGTIPHLHCAFIGGPGTGKTTIARIFGHMLYDAGFLAKRNVFVETDGLSFTSEHIQLARRGVLFIDEAYTLDPWHIALLVKAMEDCYQNFERDGFIVILAGYPYQMERMISINPGMRDRLGASIQFADYSAAELCQIFNNMAKAEGYELEDEAKELICELLRKVELMKDNNFSNGRIVRKIFERTEMRQSILFGADNVLRAASIEDVFKDEFASLIGERPRTEESFSSAAEQLTGDEQLNRLIGLESAKRQIKDFLHYAEVQKKRGGKMPSLHMRFDGNPGTGKTTLARIVGRMMYDRGLLPVKERFVESGREDLVAAYIGQTALKTKQRIREARHGVLFIDEAYSLNGGGPSDFGAEALSTLVKEMENSLNNFERDGFVCIMAGYPELMDNMVALNPGLRDRFGLTVNFEDYSAGELMQIFELYMADEKYRISKRARTILKQKLEQVVQLKDDNFANARLVRKIFERAKILQASLHDTNSCFKDDTILRVFEEADLKSLGDASAAHSNIGFA